MENEKDKVITQIRSCLISFQGKCDVRQLLDDFHMFMGYEIPYARLGYASIEKFLSSEPSLELSRTRDNLFVRAKRSEKSGHITDLVSRQKPPKSAKKVLKKYPLKSPPSTWRPKNLLFNEFGQYNGRFCNSNTSRKIQNYDENSNAIYPKAQCERIRYYRGVFCECEMILLKSQKSLQKISNLKRNW